jgi:hypothetical protein
MRKLGKRLAASDQISDADYRLLAQIAEYYQAITDAVAGRLREMGLDNTTRAFKSTTTMTDKLRRTNLPLGDIQDLAGTRIVVDGSRPDQDRIVDRIVQAFSDCQKPPDKIDRRKAGQDSHGYRAVHVIVYHDSCPMEIQVRTKLQDGWAQISEKLGDTWGRGLRYGEGPDEPGAPARPGSATTRSDVVANLQSLGNVIDGAEWREAELEGIREEMLQLDPSDRGTLPERLETVMQAVARAKEALHTALNTLLEEIGQPGGSP